MSIVAETPQKVGVHKLLCLHGLTASGGFGSVLALKQIEIGRRAPRSFMANSASDRGSDWIVQIKAEQKPAPIENKGSRSNVRSSK